MYEPFSCSQPRQRLIAKFGPRHLDRPTHLFADLAEAVRDFIHVALSVAADDGRDSGGHDADGRWHADVRRTVEWSLPAASARKLPTCAGPTH